jgi:hypothetical protein
MLISNPPKIISGIKQSGPSAIATLTLLASALMTYPKLIAAFVVSSMNKRNSKNTAASDGRPVRA